MLCFAFGQNGEVISGDSNGNIFIWPNGKLEEERLVLVKVTLNSSVRSYPWILAKTGFWCKCHLGRPQKFREVQQSELHAP